VGWGEAIVENKGSNEEPLLRTKLQLVGACLIPLVAQAHANNASINCEFAVLKQAHETLMFCGETIDPVSEARYDKLTKGFQSFIASNPDSRPGWNSVEEIQRSLLREGRDRVCKDPDYAWLREAFGRYVSDAGMAEVGSLLSRPRDPSEGDCF
jgi:hypothetical protein